MATVQQTAAQAISSVTTSGIKNKQETDTPQDRFLKLLVTQMKNQDPLKPMDNAEVTSQLAQISTVSGIEKLNTTLQLLTSSAADSRSVEAVGMIGHSAFVPGTSIVLNGPGAIAGIELDQPVDEVKVSILDSAGIAVRHMELGAQSSGLSTIAWDGVTDGGTKAVDGSYTFAVTAKQGGNDVKVNTLSFGQVNSVARSDNSTLLDMGDLGMVSLSEVRQVY